MQSTSPKAARSFLAFILTLCLGLQAPLMAVAQSMAYTGKVRTQTGSVGAAAAAGMVGARVYKLDLPDLTLNVNAISQAPSVNPALVPSASLSEIAPVPALAPSAVVSRHPAVEIIDRLQKAGVDLNQTSGQAAAAEELLAAAENLPQGKARQNMMVMAKILASPRNASGEGLEEAYDNSKIDHEALTAGPVKAEGFWGSLSRMPFLPKSLRRSFAAKAEKTRVPPPPRDLSYTEIPAGKLRNVVGLDDLPESTEEVPKSEKKIVGQDRAMQAILFGLKMPGDQYNLFVSGMDGSGRESALDLILEKLAPELPTPPDTIAVTNFETPESPIILSLPSGNAGKFKAAVKEFIGQMQTMLPQILNSGQIAAAKKAVMGKAKQSQKARQKAFDEDLAKIKLGKFGVTVVSEQQEEGIAVIVLPTFKGKSMTQEDVDKYIKDGTFTQEEFDKAKEDVGGQVDSVLEKYQAMMTESMKEMNAVQAQIDQIDAQTAASAVSTLGQGLMKLVAGGSSQTHDDKAHQELQARNMKREQAFLDEIAKLKVGRFGVVAEVAQGPGGQPTMYASLTLDNEALTEEAIAAKKVGPKEIDAAKKELSETVLPKVMESYQNLQAEIEKDHQSLHAGDKDKPSEPTAGELKAQAYVSALLRDVAKNYKDFLPQRGSEGGMASKDAAKSYKVSVLASNAPESGAPVYKARSGSHEELFGIAESPTKVLMIPGVGMAKTKEAGGPILKPGLFHKANGGFLVIQVMDILREPGAWDALMKAVRNGQAEIVEGGILNPLATTQDKHGVPGKVKVVLLGSPMIKMLLSQYDQDFVNHFNASAQFESELEINAETISAYVSFFKQMVVEGGGKIMDLSRSAMAEMITFGARLADSNEKLTAQFGQLLGLMTEATFWAKERAPTESERKVGRKMLTGEDIEMAMAARFEREGAMERRIFDIYRKGIFRSDTSGAIVGQINGLAVMGGFGVPLRMTVTMYPGEFKVASLDQEAGYTGPGFNKARAIVEGFMAHTFASDGDPIPANFRLSVEQNHGAIDGDSATSTMIYALLSKAAGVKIQQRFAVTGSADQWGFVQAIGGANQKTEGWFALTSQMINKAHKDGMNAVIIPWTNAGDLMLSADVEQAVKEGRFKIHRVRHVSEGIELLTGVSYSEILRRARINFDKLKAKRLAGR